jgi:hypothetical protein
MVRVGTLTGVVADAVRKAPLSPEKVAFAWRLAVGAALDRATSAQLTDGGVLVVRAESPAWGAALSTSVGLIRSRLDRYLGAGTIARIDIL